LQDTCKRLHKSPSMPLKLASRFTNRSLRPARFNYVGITNDLPRRAIEQFRAKGIQIEKVVGGLSRDAARAVEQALIELHGLGKEGGTLFNKINSISKKNPEYGKLVKQGLEILERIGYQ